MDRTTIQSRAYTGIPLNRLPSAVNHAMPSLALNTGALSGLSCGSGNRLSGTVDGGSMDSMDYYGTGGSGEMPVGSPYSADGSLTPADLVERLPSIVTPIATDVYAPPCDGFAQWVSENRGLATVGLILLGLAVSRGK